MTTPTITCEQFADRLADFLEREVDEPTRARVELHALSCHSCGALLADLRKLRIDAANLPELAPSRDLWVGIAERVETPVVELAPGGRIVTRTAGRPPSRGLNRRLTSVWIGAAAAGLVAATAIVTHHITKRAVVVATTQPTAPAVSRDTQVTTQVAATNPSTDSSPSIHRAPATPAPKATLVANRPSVEATYDAEIKGLRAIIAQRRSSLDTATIGVIERNLKVIDEAIAQCKQALEKDPASRFLIESLNDALDTKVHLLRTAAMLPART